ncbi:MAG: HemK2/MTQ2 family protein methyltransferase [Candidatus Pacearchaeota archaeon]
MPENTIYKPAEDSFLLSGVLTKILPSFLLKNKNLKFLEIGCGSGIQLETALKSGVKKENIFGVDINTRAVEHCKKLGFNVIKSNLFLSFKGKVVSGKPWFSHKFDVIIFNPPYLPNDSREPRSSKMATTGGKKGGELINKFLKQVKNYLADKGKIILLTSSLTGDVKFKGYNKKLLAEDKLFFERLYIWEFSPSG